MKKILVLSEFQDKIIEELSGDFEIITEYNGEDIELVIADPDAFDEKLAHKKILAVFYDGYPLHSYCDDFIIYPFRKYELYTRVQGIIERSIAFKNGDLTVDYERCSVTFKGEAVHLTLLEYRLLCILTKRCGTIVTYSEIMHQLWESPIGSEVLSVRVFINALRKKLGGKGELIKTVMGKGYMMPIIPK